MDSQRIESADSAPGPSHDLDEPTVAVTLLTMLRFKDLLRPGTAVAFPGARQTLIFSDHASSH